jgi:hypothetical protein
LLPSKAGEVGRANFIIFRFSALMPPTAAPAIEAHSNWFIKLNEAFRIHLQNSNPGNNRVQQQGSGI